MTTACQVPGTQDGQTHLYSIAFSPFKPLIPPSCCCSQCAEFSILLWLLEQGKPPCRFPWLSLSPGCSWLGKAGRDPAFLQSPVCTITSPLRNSALVIEKAKICTTYSSLQETGGVIQDAEILSLFFGWFFFLFLNSEICALDAVISGLPGALKLPLAPLSCFTVPLHIQPERMCLFPTTLRTQVYLTRGHWVGNLTFKALGFESCFTTTMGNKCGHLNPVLLLYYKIW